MNVVLTVLFHVVLPFISGFLTCVVLWLEVSRHQRARKAGSGTLPPAAVVSKPHRHVPWGGSWAKPDTPRRPGLDTMSDMWKPQPQE